MSLNQCTFLGRLTRDPEIQYGAQNDKVVARFTMAVDRIGQKDGTTGADFIPCVAFDGRAEFAEKFLRQGMRVLIGGRLRNNNYTKKDGQKVYGMEVCANIIEFADGKKDDEDVQETPQYSDVTRNQQEESSAAAGKTRNANAAPRRSSAPAQARPAAGRRAVAGTSSRSASRPATRSSAYQEDPFMNTSQQTESSLPFH